MNDMIVGGVLLVIIGLAVRYIYRSKKAGVKCIGCPASGCCNSGKQTGDSCCSQKKI